MDTGEPAPAGTFEVCRTATAQRVCAGCTATIDLREYGCVSAAATVVCPGCGRCSRVGDLERT